MPAMERVRLDVLETRRNSEKPKPKARIPPRRRLPRTHRSSPVSWKRKIFSEVDKWRPETNRDRERRGRQGLGSLLALLNSLCASLAQNGGLVC